MSSRDKHTTSTKGASQSSRNYIDLVFQEKRPLHIKGRPFLSALFSFTKKINCYINIALKSEAKLELQSDYNRMFFLLGNKNLSCATGRRTTLENY